MSDLFIKALKDMSLGILYVIALAAMMLVFPFMAILHELRMLITK